MFSVTYRGNFLSSTETQSTEIDKLYVGTFTITCNNIGVARVANSYNSSVTFTKEPILINSTTVIKYEDFFGVGLTTSSFINSVDYLIGDLASVEGFDGQKNTSLNSITSVSSLTISRDISINSDSSPVVYSTFSNLPGAWRIPADQNAVISYTDTLIKNLTQGTTIDVFLSKSTTIYGFRKTTSDTVSIVSYYNYSRNYEASTIGNYSTNSNYSVSTYTSNPIRNNRPVVFPEAYAINVYSLYHLTKSSIGINSAGTYVSSTKAYTSNAYLDNNIFSRPPANFTDPTTTYTTTSLFISSINDTYGLAVTYNGTAESSDNYTRIMSIDNTGVFYNVSFNFWSHTSSKTSSITSAGSGSIYTYRFSNFNPIYEIESTTYEEKYSTITETSANATIYNISTDVSTVKANIYISETEIGKTYNDLFTTESTSVISSTRKFLTSALDVVSEYLSSSSKLVTLTDRWASHYTSTTKYSAQYYATIESIAVAGTGYVSSNWENTYSTTELKSSTMYSYGDTFRAFSTIDIYYTLTDDRINASATYSRSSSTSEIFTSFDVYSTYSDYKYSQTVDINGNYTYYTTYFGTLEVGILDTTLSTASSWLNVAAARTRSYSTTSINYSGQFFKESRYSSTSSFGISEYNLTYITISSSYLESFNNPMSTRKTVYSSYLNTYSSLRKGVINTSFYTDVTFSTDCTKITLKDYATDFWIDDLAFTTIINGTAIDSNTYTNTLSYMSTAYNTSDFGSTARLSSLVSSKNWVNVFNTYLADNYAYTYNVSSVWNYDNSITETLSEYSTALVTSFKKTYSTEYDYDSYSYTESSSTNVLTTEGRFINRNGITGSSTLGVSVTNTVAVYNGSTMATMNSTTILGANNVSRSISVIDYTFISDINDFTSSDSVVDTFTTSNVRKQFVNSISTVVSSTMEQQNDTLVFKSEIATFSTYNASSTYSTISTLEINYEATTYTEEYNPISYIASSTVQSTSLAAGTMLKSTSESVIHTQSVGYTPIYTTVNGIYITN